MSSYRPALRIARRDALRSKGRTALVVCMIGLPVAAIVALGVLLKTSHWSPRESLPYELGTADARLTSVGHARVQQDPLTGDTMISRGPGGPDAERHWTTEEITRRVVGEYGPDARVLPMNQDISITLETSRGRLRTQLTELDVRDPLARGILEITDGRAPAGPDEIALGAELADRGPFPLGSTVRIGREGTAKRVVGYVRDHRAPGRPLAVALPGALPDTLSDPRSRDWLVDVGQPVTWADVQAFNSDGVTVVSRHVVAHPPSDAPSIGGRGAQETAVLALAVAMIVLEVVLLAGPAFAVGVRRRRRMLALVSVAGGEPRHLRAVVLAGGLVLGGAAALLGMLLGIAAAAVTAAVVPAVTDMVPGPFEVPWLLVVLTALLGAGSGLAAAYLPARQAKRMDVVAALAGRREPAGARGRRSVRPIAGAVLICGGVLCCLFGVQMWREFGAAFGAVGIIIGTVMVVPSLVGAAGRAARPLPVPLRLAVREGTRNVARSAPAVAAITAAVAGTTVLAIANTSDLEQARMDYRARLPVGSALIGPPVNEADEVRGALERELPGVPLVDVRTLAGEHEACPTAGTSPCPFAKFPAGGSGPIEWHAVVGGAPVARLLLGRSAPQVEEALAAGRIVLFGGTAGAEGGTTTATVAAWENERRRTIRQVPELPAVAVELRAHVRAIVPPAAAERIGVPVRPQAFGVDRAEHRLTHGEAERVQEVVNGHQPGGNVYVERGFSRSNAALMFVLLAVSSVLTLGGALIATGLAAADARPELAVLAAVGARPRTRRLLAAGQAAFVAVLGCWVGIAAGIVPGIAASRALTGGPPVNGGPGHGPVLDIPWTVLLAMGIAVPLIAAVVAGVCTRSRLPITRAAEA